MQHELTINAAIPAAQDNQQRGVLLQQLLELTDILLEGCKTEIEAVRQVAEDSYQLNELRHRYEADRRKLILPFSKSLLLVSPTVGARQTDRAHFQVAEP